MNTELRALIQRDCQEAVSDNVGKLEALRNDRILITGGTGFLGTWLAELLAYLNDNHGFSIRMILLSTRASRFHEKSPHLASRKDVLLVEQDIRQSYDIPKDVRWIVHAACSPDSRWHASDPMDVVDVVVNGTSTMLSSATRLSELKKFLNVSSGWVYGSQPEDRKRVSEAAWGPLNPHTITSVYPEAKRCGETVCAAYANEHRFPIVNARPFAYVGPYQLLDKPWAVNNFIRDALLGGPIRMLGSPETVRSYLYASEMAYWILRILVDGRSGQSYNVGSPHGVTLRELAEIIASHFPGVLEIRAPLLQRESQPRSVFVPDTSLAESELGLRATLDLRSAIGRTLTWNQTLRTGGVAV